MWNIIRRWLFNRSRYVYSFWNGQRYVKADPLVLWRALQANEDYREEDFKLLKVDALRNDLIGKIAEITRTVFGIKFPDEGGLTELECMDVLRVFIAYSGFQKKSGVLRPTLPTVTEPESSVQPETAPQNTNESLDSTSTSTE